VHHGGQQRAGEEVAGHHGEGDGFCERGEEEFCGTGEHHDRHEHDADGERGDEGRRGDLLRGVQDGLGERKAFGHVAMRVFDFDGGVVDEDADGERETAEGHDVDSLAERGEDDERCGDGERDGDADDQRGTPRAEEEQDHQAGEQGGDGGFADDFVDGGADEDGLIEERGDFEIAQAGRELRNHLLGL